MSNSHEQNLDEDAVFQPVNEAFPYFLYCEKERQAVEILLSEGPEAFYSSIVTERCGCFLSSEEVRQITSWAQDNRINPQQVQREANGEEGSSEKKDVCSTYFPSYSDTPAPNLELGWPEKRLWLQKTSVVVHTSPPAEGEPPVREIIRRHLQNASQVIAIVTDRLTDVAIIGDLHTAATLGVPVYIILNQRSIQENFTLKRLRHPNMQVRVLEGKPFRSRTGRKVVGEMKDKFLLVDLETVIHGSYSLTWTDAHLHRQLITVLKGTVVNSFDQEFRKLFAASLPVTDTWRVAGTHVDVTHLLKDPLHLRVQKNLLLDSELANPPSPPADSLLDWEAMGVVQGNVCFPGSLLDQYEETVAKEMPNNTLFDKNTPIMDSFTDNGRQFVMKERVCENTPPGTTIVPDKLTTINTFNNTQHSPTDTATPGISKRVEHITEEALSMQLSIEKSPNLDDRSPTPLDDKATEPSHNMKIHISKKREHSRREPILREEGSINETSSNVENTSSSRKPIILRQQNESFSSRSSITKRFSSQQRTLGALNRGSKATVSEMSRSMMDLSISTDTNHDERGVPVQSFKDRCFDPGHMTPALSLMKRRKEDWKSVSCRTSKTLLSTERPRSNRYSIYLRLLAEPEGGKE